MPISKEAAHARAVKAAETRAYNKAHGIVSTRAKKAPAFPTSYHATPTRHVTRDLRLKQTPRKPPREKHPALPRSMAAVKRLDNATLQRTFNYWWNQPGSNIPKWRNADRIVYELRDELRRRAARDYPNLPRIQAHRARRGVRKERGKK